MDKGYILIDGTYLFHAIDNIRRTKPEFSGKKLNLDIFSTYLIRSSTKYFRSTIRCVFYFKKSDKRIETMLTIPDTTIPGTKNHWQIKECAESTESIPDEEIQKLSPQYQDCFPRSEKGLDIKLACDALKIVTGKNAGNIVFLINDRDYTPLLETIQDLGANTYIAGLHSSKKVQKSLVDLADAFFTLDPYLEIIFEIPKVATAS